jgi:hypothetical protein
LKSVTIELRSNDCANVELSPVSRTGPTGNRFGFAPGLEITLPIHTNGTRPVKMPVPPRTWVWRSPLAFQLNPTRGEKRGSAPGRSLWSTVSGLSAASNAVRPRENGLSIGSV